MASRALFYKVGDPQGSCFFGHFSRRCARPPETNAPVASQRVAGTMRPATPLALPAAAQDCKLSAAPARRPRPHPCHTRVCSNHATGAAETAGAAPLGAKLSHPAASKSNVTSKAPPPAAAGAAAANTAAPGRTTRGSVAAAAAAAGRACGGRVTRSRRNASS